MQVETEDRGPLSVYRPVHARVEAIGYCGGTRRFVEVAYAAAVITFNVLILQ